jgi:hypothetical protein
MIVFQLLDHLFDVTEVDLNIDMSLDEASLQESYFFIFYDHYE